MATKITSEEIKRMTKLYAKYGNYAAVAREVGRSASAVRKYILLKGTPEVVKDTFKDAVRGKR